MSRAKLKTFTVRVTRTTVYEVQARDEDEAQDLVLADDDTVKEVDQTTGEALAFEGAY